MFIIIPILCALRPLQLAIAQANHCQLPLPARLAAKHASQPLENIGGPGRTGSA
jgi:hypothetical protein